MSTWESVTLHGNLLVNKGRDLKHHGAAVAQEEDAKPAVSTSGRAGVTPKKRKEGGAEVEAAADVEEEAGRCEAVVTLPLDYPKLLMMELVQRVAAATMIRATPGARNPLRLPLIIPSLYLPTTSTTSQTTIYPSCQLGNLQVQNP